MPKEIVTAASLKARRVIVTVPDEESGEDLRFACRRPDPIPLFVNGQIPLDVYAAVVEKCAGPMSDFAAAGLKEPGLYGDFIDKWVCAAAVEPRIVFTAEEAASDDAIWVQDLEYPIRFAIFTQTCDRLASKWAVDAVAEFRRHQSVDHPVGSDGPPVLDAAVAAVGG